MAKFKSSNADEIISLCSLFVNAQTTNIYQPPYKLMQQAAAQKQAQYDAFFNKYYDFVNSINITHLDAEDENYNALLQCDIPNQSLHEEEQRCHFLRLMQQDRDRWHSTIYLSRHIA